MLGKAIRIYPMKFYTARVTELPSHEIKRNLLRLPRKLLLAVHTDLAALILGEVCWYWRNEASFLGTKLGERPLI
jgi:hypothetical protein